MTVDYSGGEPLAWAILTDGETGDRDSPLFTVQTQRFSDKRCREVASPRRRSPPTPTSRRSSSPATSEDSHAIQ